PPDKVTALVGQVTPAFFSAVQMDPPALRRYLLRITEGIALITFPVSLGLALVARDFVLVVLGPKWEGTAAPLQVLAAYAAIGSPVCCCTASGSRHFTSSSWRPAEAPRDLCEQAHQRGAWGDSPAAGHHVRLRSQRSRRWPSVGGHRKVPRPAGLDDFSRHGRSLERAYRGDRRAGGVVSASPDPGRRLP